MASPYLDAQARNGAATPYLVHLLLDEAVPTDRDAVIDGLRRRLGRVEPVEGSGPLHFALPDYPARFGPAVFPLQVAVLALEGIGIDELAASLRQSWTWADAAEVAAGCRAQLTLADFFGAGLDRRVRLAVFHGAVATLLELLPVRAIQWVPSGQVVSPEAYLARIREGEGLRGSAVNVRRFRLSSDSGSVQVLDTLGLRAFGLPDLQCRFAGPDPAAMSEWLHAQALRLFEEPDRFRAGGEVSLREGAALAGPSRSVLELDPAGA